MNRSRFYPHTFPECPTACRGDELVFEKSFLRRPHTPQEGVGIYFLFSFLIISGVLLFGFRIARADIPGFPFNCAANNYYPYDGFGISGPPTSSCTAQQGSCPSNQYIQCNAEGNAFTGVLIQCDIPNDGCPTPQNPLSVSCSPKTSTLNVGDVRTFTGSASGGAGSYSYQWSNVTCGAGTTNTTQQCTLFFGAPGTYRPTVAVTSGGQTARYSCTVNVASQRPKYRCSGSSCIRDDVNGTLTDPSCNNQCAQPPQCTLVISPPSGSVQRGNTSQFNALYDPDGPSGSQGEQNVSSSANWRSDNTAIASHQGSGRFRGENEGSTGIHATYSGCSGRQADASLTVTSAPNNPPVINSCDINPKSGTAPLNTNYTSSVSDPDGDSISIYRWNFGFGNTDRGPSGSFTYTNQGTFTVILQAQDARGVWSSQRTCGVVNVGTANQLPVGTHDTNDNASCTAQGWTTDPDNRNIDLTVKIYSDGSLIKTDTASRFRPDLQGAGVCPGGTCAFVTSLSGAISPGVSHSIEVRGVDAQTGQEQRLGGTPKSITCSAITCNSDSQCNDSNSCTTDRCENPGTASARCTNTVSGSHKQCQGTICQSVSNTASACTDTCTNDLMCGGGTVTVSGRVFNETSGAGFSGATITTCRSSPATVLTDSNGNFSFTVPAGQGFCARVAPEARSGFNGPSLNNNSGLAWAKSYEWQIAGKHCASQGGCTSDQNTWDRASDSGYDFKYQSVSVASNNASCLNITAPNTVTPGQSFSASVTMQNSGAKTWTTDSTPHRLGSQNPQDNSRWGLGRVGLPSGSIAPGSSVTFNFNATAPTAPGAYPFDWKMLEEAVEWFGATCQKTITVNPSGVNCDTSYPSDQFHACYFDGTNPPAGAAPVLAQNNESTIDHNWGFGQVNATGKNNQVSAIWRGKINFPAGNYVFHTISDDGVTLNLEGFGDIISNWTDHTPTQNDSASIALPAGPRNVTLKWYENGGGAAIRLWWDSDSTCPVVGQSRPFSTCQGNTCVAVNACGTSTCSSSSQCGGTQTLSASLTANPSSGTAPLNGVDLTATPFGTAVGTITYKFDCTNDGTFEHVFSHITEAPKTVVDACNYSSAGAYTARVRVERGSATPASASATITVSPVTPPPTADIRANDADGSTTITYGSSAIIEWCGPNAAACANATSCSVSPTGWTGTSRTRSTGALTAAQTYTLTCTGPGGTRSDSVTVNISIPQLTASCLVSPASAKIGDTVTWSALAAGGIGSYTFLWDGSPDPNPLDGRTGNPVAVTYATEGQKNGIVTVRSGSQEVASSLCVNSATGTPGISITKKPPQFEEIPPE